MKSATNSKFKKPVGIKFIQLIRTGICFVLLTSYLALAIHFVPRSFNFILDRV